MGMYMILHTALGSSYWGGKQLKPFVNTAETLDLWQLWTLNTREWWITGKGWDVFSWHSYKTAWVYKIYIIKWSSKTVGSDSKTNDNVWVVPPCLTLWSINFDLYGVFPLLYSCLGSMCIHTNPPPNTHTPHPLSLKTTRWMLWVNFDKLNRQIPQKYCNGPLWHVIEPRLTTRT